MVTLCYQETQAMKAQQKAWAAPEDFAPQQFTIDQTTLHTQSSPSRSLSKASPSHLSHHRPSPESAPEFQ